MLIRNKLEELAREYKSLEEEMGKPEIIGGPRYLEISQKYARLRKIMEPYDRLKTFDQAIAEAQGLLKDNDNSDGELRALAQEELAQAEPARDRLLEEIRLLLVPEDPRDANNAIVEIRGGAGGDESALFAAELFRMYRKYSEMHRLNIDLLEAHATPLGGFKQVTFSVVGNGAYGKFKFESGVHRVQRVPDTEASGRVHTSTITVAVLPEVEDIDIVLKDEDLEISTFRSSGPGGQNVNKVESAVRIVHKPTGLVVACQEERSQHKNKEKALKLLRARLQERSEEEQQQKQSQQRRIQIGSAARSEKIRTYNFPQNRVTDHRIGLTLHELPEVMEGNIAELIEALSKAYREDQLVELESPAKAVPVK
jgi:peptide chain release factor 1